MEDLRFGVVGAGIIGAAVARELMRSFPGAAVTVLEKEDRPAAHQTGHNSGVVHAGLYYEPGSLKARLCRRGVQLLSEYARSKGIAYDQCGKLLVATNTLEVERLEAIFERTRRNGVPGVKMLDRSEMLEIEPEVRGVKALYSPETAITDYPAITEALIDDVVQLGGTVHFSTEVTEIHSGDTSCVVTAGQKLWEFDYLVVCAGLQSDRVAEYAGGAEFPKIVPFFGQYSALEARCESLTRGLVYPVPDPAYPFLGVHLTKRVDGAMWVGPNAFLSGSRESYNGIPLDLRDLLDIAKNVGFWKFAPKNIVTGLRELRGLASQKAFVEAAAELVPAVKGAVARRLDRGVRAQAIGEDGTLVDDFVVEYVGRSVLLRNAPSPGATSSFAIAEHIVDELNQVHNLGCER